MSSPRSLTTEERRLYESALKYDPETLASDLSWKLFQELEAMKKLLKDKIRQEMEFSNLMGRDYEEEQKIRLKALDLYNKNCDATDAIDKDKFDLAPLKLELSLISELKQEHNL